LQRCSVARGHGRWRVVRVWQSVNLLGWAKAQPRLVKGWRNGPRKRNRKQANKRFHGKH